MTSTSINQANQAEITNIVKATLNGQVEVDGHGDTGTLPYQQAQAENNGKPESELRAAARRHGYTLKQLASLMGVNYNHLCSVANGRRPWTADLREKVSAVLGEVPGQGVVYRRGGLVQSESTFIRERAREKGLNLKDLAVVVGVSYGYITDVCRGRRSMSPSLQARVESALGGPVEIAPAECANRQEHITGGGSSYLRERAREKGMSMGELADLVGVSRRYLSQASRGKRNLGPAVQARVEAVLEAPVRVEAAQPPTVDPRVLWDRMEAHGYSQNETARRAGISSSLLSQIMNGKRIPSGSVLRRLYEVLFRPVQPGAGGPGGIEGHGLEEGRAATAWWSRAPAGRAATRSAPAAGCPGAPRWSSPTPAATTAGAGFR